MNTGDAVFRGTTILLVKKANKVVIAGDGQVSFGDTVLKHTAKKIRRVYNNRVLVGFAGSTADAFALFSRLESKLEQFQGNLNRAAVELAQEWRTDRALRHLEAYLLATDGQSVYLLSGTGDVIEPDDGVLAEIGRRFCPCRRTRFDAQHQTAGCKNRQGSANDSQRDMRLYKQPNHRRGIVALCRLSFFE
jgi:ATP-dependent HslUV protease, peptidase subunit HslV